MLGVIVVAAATLLLASERQRSAERASLEPRLVIADADAGIAAGDNAGRPPAATPLADTQSEPGPPAPSEAAEAADSDAIAPLATPTELPTGLLTCARSDLPAPEGSYIVDTNGASLKHRAEPSASAALLGESARATRGLLPTGQCVLNEFDGFTWWLIDRGDERFWVASAYLTLDD